MVEEVLPGLTSPSLTQRTLAASITPRTSPGRARIGNPGPRRAPSGTKKGAKRDKRDRSPAAKKISQLVTIPVYPGLQTDFSHVTVSLPEGPAGPPWPAGPTARQIAAELASHIFAMV